MFSLLYGFAELLLRKDEFHVLILGLDKAGKTNLLERLKTLFTDFMGLEPSKILPTVGLNVGRMDAFNSALIFWDLGGAPGLRSIWDKYYGESHAVLFVVDAADRGRWEEAKGALDKALGNWELTGAPLLVIANKQDLPGAADAAEVAEHFGLGKGADLEGRAVLVQLASAHTGQGVHEGLKWLVDAVRKSSRRAQMLHKSVRYTAG